MSSKNNSPKPSNKNSYAEPSKQFNKVKPPLTEAELKQKKRKKRIIIAIITILVLAGIGVAIYFIFFFHPDTAEEPKAEQKTAKIYSKLSGLEIKSESENTLPTYCIQIPNGTDGARPQVGLNQAPVVFEAIAEAGITRFAAVFQNPTSKAIGPIRSLRSYYLDWDTPFDCTIVHAGGSDEAIEELAAGDYRDLTESYDYMWRDTSGYWAPNNLMTSPALLSEFATANKYTSSDPKVLPRLTPDEASNVVSEVKAQKEGANNSSDDSDSSSSSNSADSSDKSSSSDSTKTDYKLASEIAINFGTVSDFNTIYKYDENTNTYARSYANGEAHLVYSCDNTDKTTPLPKSDCGIAQQVAPSAVAVMMVDEHLDSDGYHHVIQTVGTGIAYVFQNGTVTKGTWKKSSKSAQIEFKDSSNNIISFTPGQLWIAAVPNSGGSVKY